MVIDMKEMLTGVVVRASTYGESGKMLTLLTAGGRRSVYLAGARGFKNRAIIMSQLFTYGEYTVNTREGRSYVTDLALIENFFELHEDPLKLSLASYICQVCEQVSVENEDESELLALALNMFYVLTVKEIDPLLVKAVFEARVMVLSGIAPDVEGCRGCGEERELLYLDVMEGNLVCPACLMKEEQETAEHPPQDEVRTARILLPTERGTRAHLTYLLHCMPKKVFQYDSDPDVIPSLGGLTETYLLNQLECRASALATFRSLLAGAAGFFPNGKKGET